MLTSGAAIVSELFLLDVDAQFEAGTRIETRAGQSPTGIPRDSATANGPVEHTQVTIAAVPLISVRWLEGLDDSRMDSAIRTLWRPVPLPNARPLFLETLSVSHGNRPSKRSQWRTSLQGSYGEQDYTSRQQQLPNQPTLPLTTTILLVNATANASWRRSRQRSWTLQLSGLHRRSFNAASTENGAASSYGALPAQTTVSAAPRLTYRLGRRSTLEARATIADTGGQGNTQQATSVNASQASPINSLMNQPEVGVRHQHTWRHDLHLAAGLSQVYSLRNTESQSISKYPSPILQVDLGSLLQLTRTTIVRSTVSAESAAFVDPVLGVAVSRGTATAGIDIQRGPWSGGARLAFTTDLTSLPSQNTPSTTSSGQTFVSVEIPFRYRSSRQLTVEFGGRYSERAPYLGTKNFAWHNREMWLFLNITTTATPSSTRS